MKVEGWLASRGQPPREAASRKSAPTRYAVAAHEAGHCVAAFCVGLDVDRVEIEAPRFGHPPASHSKLAAGSAYGRRGPVFDHAIALLGGPAYMASIGQDVTGSDGDIEKARVLVDSVSSSPAASRRAFAVVVESTGALVESHRFQTLAACLTPELDAGRLRFGPEIKRFLREHDPAQTRSSFEAHSALRRAPWYEVTARASGKPLYRGSDRREAYRVLRANTGAQLVGGE